MKSLLLKFVFLFIATSSICGVCSKDDAGSDENSDSNNTAVEPDLKPDDTWLYFDDAPSLVNFYNSIGNNNRPSKQKWIATKIEPAYVSSLDTSNNEHFFTWSFENSGHTRFLSNTLNPGGRERMNVLIQNFSGVSGDGTYTSDMANRQLYCWYYVYTSSGALHDSVHAAGITNSTFNITKMEFVQAMGSVVDRYKMTGDATFNVFYWPSGTASTQTSIPCTASLTMYL